VIAEEIDLEALGLFGPNACCLTCEKEFKKRVHNQKYCSRRCLDISKIRERKYRRNTDRTYKEYDNLTQRLWYAKNKEHAVSRNKRWRENNRDKVLEYDKRRRDKEKHDPIVMERKCKVHRRWRENNPEKERIRSAKEKRIRAFIRQLVESGELPNLQEVLDAKMRAVKQRRMHAFIRQLIESGEFPNLKEILNAVD
jgi:Arc/MetJ-type ribon-helix-helix transcriptional regulator